MGTVSGWREGAAVEAAPCDVCGGWFGEPLLFLGPPCTCAVPTHRSVTYVVKVTSVTPPSRPRAPVTKSAPKFPRPKRVKRKGS